MVAELAATPYGLVMVLSPSTLCLESDDEKLGMVADWQPLGLLCFWQSSDFVLMTRASKQLNPSTTAECVVSLVNREVGVIANPSQQTQLLFISFTKHIRLPECAKAHKGWLPTYQPLPNTT